MKFALFHEIPVARPGDRKSVWRAYEARGWDLILGLVNFYDITHEAVLETIDRMGRCVIPEFA